MSEPQGLNKGTIYGLLREIHDVARHAAMTGSLRKSAPILIETYNNCLKALAETDPTVSTLFSGLSTEAHGLDEVGASAALLARYIQPKEAGAPFPGRRMIKYLFHPGHGPVPPPPFGSDEGEDNE